VDGVGWSVVRAIELVCSVDDLLQCTCLVMLFVELLLDDELVLFKSFARWMGGGSLSASRHAVVVPLDSLCLRQQDAVLVYGNWKSSGAHD
jgi:hypothetical protein